MEFPRFIHQSTEWCPTDPYSSIHFSWTVFHVASQTWWFTLSLNWYLHWHWYYFLLPVGDSPWMCACHLVSLTHKSPASHRLYVTYDMIGESKGIGVSSGQLHCCWVGGLWVNAPVPSPFLLYISLCLHYNKGHDWSGCFWWILLMKSTVGPLPSVVLGPAGRKTPKSSTYITLYSFR